MPWWGYVLVALVFTHLTIAGVTIYLHRNQAHRALDLHPLVSHFFRLWLWLSTGMNTREWTAVQRTWLAGDRQFVPRSLGAGVGRGHLELRDLLHEQCRQRTFRPGS